MPFRSVHFYDSLGVPLTGLSPTLTYVDRLGSPVTPPAVVPLTGGAYGIVIPSVDETTGVIVIFDGGVTAFPRRQVLTCSKDGLLAWMYLNPDGTPFSGPGSPTIPLFVDPTGTPRTPPVVSLLFSWLFTATASGADLAIGVSFRITAPGVALPAYYTGTLESVSAGMGIRPILNGPWDASR